MAISGRQLECTLQKNSLAAQQAQIELESKVQPDEAKAKRSKVGFQLRDRAGIL